MSSSGDTYLSFPALSESGIAVTLLSRNTTSFPKSFAFMSSAAFAPNLDDMTLSYASGLPPLWVCPGIAILISCVVYALSLSASSYATDGYGLLAIASFLFFFGSSAISFGIAPSATATIVKPLLSFVLLSIALYTLSISVSYTHLPYIYPPLCGNSQPEVSACLCHQPWILVHSSCPLSTVRTPLYPP